MRTVIVALVHKDRAFGGPEEGGWYYDTFTPSEDPEHLQHMRVFRVSDTDAYYIYQIIDQLETIIRGEGWNDGLHKPESVLSEGQWLEPYAFIDELPCCIPKAKPTF